MKQIISRTIQVCLIAVVMWWLGYPMITFLIENEPSKKEVVDLCLSEDEAQQLYVSILDSYREHLAEKKTLLQQGGDLGAQEYFKVIVYTDSLQETNEVLYLSEVGHHMIKPQIELSHRDFINSSYELFRGGVITSSQINDARELILPKPPTSEPVKLSDFNGLFNWLLKSYWLLGLLIAIGSINRVWRDCSNTVLFDPRSRIKFLAQLLIWPVRFGLWVRGNIVIRQYADKPLRVLTQQETKLVSNFVDGVKGYTNLHSYFQYRGIIAKRSFFLATLFFMLSLLPKLSGRTHTIDLPLVQITVSESQSNAPPCYVQNHHQDEVVETTPILKPQYVVIENIFLVLIKKVISTYVCLIYPKILYIDPTWRPPENVELSQ